MAELHRIRLRDWEQRTADDGLCFVRRFGCPTGLSAQADVAICFPQLRGSADVTLNGEQLDCITDAAGLVRAEIATRLRPRNEVVVRTKSAADFDGVAYLEITDGPATP